MRLDPALIVKTATELIEEHAQAIGAQALDFVGLPAIIRPSFTMTISPWLGQVALTSRTGVTGRLYFAGSSEKPQIGRAHV